MDRSNHASPVLLVMVKEERTAGVLFARTVRPRPSSTYFSFSPDVLCLHTNSSSFYSPLFPLPSSPRPSPYLHSCTPCLAPLRQRTVRNSSLRAKPVPVSPLLGRCNLVRPEQAVLSLSLLLLLFTSPSFYSLSLLLVHSQNTTLHLHTHSPSV
jgi:hypothetical protein